MRNGSGQSGGCLTWKPAFRGCPVVPVTATASRRCWLCPAPPLRPCPRAHLPPASQPPASGLRSHRPNKPPPRGHKESLCFKFRLARLSYGSFGTRQHPTLLKQAPRASLARSPPDTSPQRPPATSPWVPYTITLDRTQLSSWSSLHICISSRGFYLQLASLPTMLLTPEM